MFTYCNIVKCNTTTLYVLNNYKNRKKQNSTLLFTKYCLALLDIIKLSYFRIIINTIVILNNVKCHYK